MNQVTYYACFSTAASKKNKVIKRTKPNKKKKWKQNQTQNSIPLPVNVLQKKPNGMRHLMRVHVLFYYFFHE